MPSWRVVVGGGSAAYVLEDDILDGGSIPSVGGMTRLFWTIFWIAVASPQWAVDALIEWNNAFGWRQNDLCGQRRSSMVHVNRRAAPHISRAVQSLQKAARQHTFGSGSIFWWAASSTYS